MMNLEEALAVAEKTAKYLKSGHLTADRVLAALRESCKHIRDAGATDLQTNEILMSLMQAVVKFYYGEEKGPTN
jgi:hypothetical protein